MCDRKDRSPYYIPPIFTPRPNEGAQELHTMWSIAMYSRGHCRGSKTPLRILLLHAVKL